MSKEASRDDAEARHGLLSSGSNPPAYASIPTPTAPYEDDIVVNPPIAIAERIEVKPSGPDPEYGVTEQRLLVADDAPVMASSTVNRRKPRLRYNLGRNPVHMKCPYCQADTVTIPKDCIGSWQILCTIFLFFFCCPLVWLPWCIPS